MSQLPPPPPPPWQQPPPPPPPPAGTLVVELQGSMMTSSVVAPTVRINGWPVPASYGANSYPLAPGRWHVDVSAQWMRTYGQASIDVDLGPGQLARVHYAAPWHQFTTGSIGFEQQSRKGCLPVLLGLGAIALVTLLLVLAIALGS